MKCDINVTPLIDVLLVLLIIFMLVAPVAPRGLAAALPEQRHDGESARGPASLVLEVRADGFSLNSRPAFTPIELADRLHSALDGRVDRTVFVRVEDGVDYARVIEALDIAEGAGASRIGLMTEERVPRGVAVEPPGA